jgi:capsule assembly protein Wzi/PAP2 superfamily protein
MRIVFITRNFSILLGFGLAASSLTLTARVSRCVPRQADERSGGDTKESSSAADVKEISPEKKFANDPLSEYPSSPPRGFKGLTKEFLEDQKQIWTSPAKLQFSDTQWLVPLSGIAAGLFVTDTEYSRHLSHNPATISHYTTISNAGIGALIGGAGGMWLLGHVKHNEHWSETGFLAGEAALNSLVMVESLKYSLGRERPYQGNGTGPFFQGGTSFPSEHAAAAWSVAGVIAHEYPNPFVKIAVYGLASLVDYSRIHGHQHFPSDVFVGSIMGNLIAQNIYTRNHDPGLGGEAWKSISQIFRGDGSSTPANQGSPYVPLDSWIYPALDRLIGMGMIDSGFSGVRPWTRNECARLLAEASDRVDGGPADAQRTYQFLEAEFEDELGESTGSQVRGRIESVYTRSTEISGQPLSLTDGYTFGQTLINDFGRPYERGFNSVTGFSAWTSAGRWVAYVRGEYQQSPSAPALSESARLTIAAVDPFPGPPPATPTLSVHQFQFLDAYVGLNFNNWQVSFGQQSLSWGAGNGGSLELSNNAPPIKMFHISRVTPLELPRFLRWLGPMRTEFFFGQLTGQEFMLTPAGPIGQYGQSLNPQPFIHGQLISFKPTPNFEFAFYRTTIFAGAGYPLTSRSLISSLVTTGNSTEGAQNKPGNRTSGLDFSYRLPGLRNWLTLYGDGYTDDEFSPIAYVNISAWHAGLYLSHLPRVSRLDLRVEGVYTDIPGGTSENTKDPGSFYQNGTWRSGYTNNGDLIGSWVGRGGQGAQAWSNYWFSPRNRLQLFFRHQKVSQEFVPGGGSLTDVGARTDYSLRSNLSLTVSVQHERWLFPVIQPNVAHNVTASVGITFEPQRILHTAQSDTTDKTPANGVRP